MVCGNIVPGNRWRQQLSSLRIKEIESNGVGPCSLDMAPGECVCVSGVSGAGKTLMLRAIADLDPHHGKVFLDDVECNDMSPGMWRHSVGLLPAESQWWYETVGAHFVETSTALLNALDFDGEVLDYQVSRLSSGERQRLALVRLLCNQPKALLLDEPTASLDPKNTLRVEQLIKDYCSEHHSPALWVSHDPGQIRRVAARHFEMAEGKLSTGDIS
jgi:ABC-type iron transport system FetAB ATPase subunit